MLARRPFGAGWLDPLTSTPRAVPAGVWRRCILSPMDTIDIASLSPDQRPLLLEQIWDILAATPDAVPGTSAQREELSRRLDELDRVGPAGIPWDEVLRKVRGQS